MRMRRCQVRRAPGEKDTAGVLLPPVWQRHPPLLYILNHASALLLPLPLPLPMRAADETLVDLWLTTVGVLAKRLCKDESQQLRDGAIMALRWVGVWEEGRVCAGW